MTCCNSPCNLTGSACKQWPTTPHSRFKSRIINYLINYAGPIAWPWGHQRQLAINWGHPRQLVETVLEKTTNRNATNISPVVLRCGAMGPPTPTGHQLGPPTPNGRNCTRENYEQKCHKHFPSRNYCASMGCRALETHAENGV